MQEAIVGQTLRALRHAQAFDVGFRCPRTEPHVAHFCAQGARHVAQLADRFGKRGLASKIREIGRPAPRPKTTGRPAPQRNRVWLQRRALGARLRIAGELRLRREGGIGAIQQRIAETDHWFLGSTRPDDTAQRS